MRRRRIPRGPSGALAVVLSVLLPAAAARADDFTLATELGETYQYVSPWGQGEPMTSLGLRFWNIDHDVDLGVGASYGRAWGGDVEALGRVSVDFSVRIHDSLSGDDIEPFVLFGVGYAHYWAEEAFGMTPGPAASWTTREGFGVRLGGGVIFTLDEFYLDLTAYGETQLLWPEPSFLAGGGGLITLGVYVE